MNTAALLKTTAALTGLLGALTASPLMSCTCATSSPRDNFANADSVFVGVPIAATPVEGSFGPSLRYSFFDLWVWKGRNPAPQVTSSIVTASCGKPLILGQLYLVYASKTSAGFSTGLCSRTRLLPFSQPDFLYRLTGANLRDIPYYGSVAILLIGTVAVVRRTRNRLRPAA